MLNNYVGPLMYTCRSTVFSDWLEVQLTTLAIDISEVHN